MPAAQRTTQPTTTQLGRLAAAACKIRQQWSTDERSQRAQRAEGMQLQLLQLAGAKFVPVPVKKAR